MRIFSFVWIIIIAGLIGPVARAGELPIIKGVEAQPLKSQARRIVQTLDFLGEPLSRVQHDALDRAFKELNEDKAVVAIQKVFDPLCIAGVDINPESRVKVAAGPAPKKLHEQGWRVLLVKVTNQAGVTAPLRFSSPNAAPTYQRWRFRDVEPTVQPEELPNRWLSIAMFDKQPLTPALSGLEVEYRIVQLYSRDRGKREAKLFFDVGQGTQDIGFRNELAVLFNCAPAVKVMLEVLDDDGTTTTGKFTFRDTSGRVYPARSRRLAPDFFFHDQVYRHSGEHILLPPGRYHVTYTRGPEYRVHRRTITISASETEHQETFRLERWIKLPDRGWYSSDHHIHAAGCAHYDSPTQGVTPKDMMRHILGEDLNVGCVLSWAGGWRHQKNFFSGEVDKLSTPSHLMRYDVEVAGFPSSHAGHLCLLNLKEDDYIYPEPVDFEWTFEWVLDSKKGRMKGRETTQIGEWPSWDLPVLKWAKSQGAVTGFAHSGSGIGLPDYMPDGSRQFPPGKRVGWTGRAPDKLPDYAMPRFNGIGANEYIVDVVHGVCDFIAAVNTPSVWELNIWYHTLNCGFTCRISGETDFPCIHDERVGLGRAYVKIDKREPLTYANWVHGIRDGRSYCSDGLSHLFDYQVNGLGVGEKGTDDRISFLSVKQGELLRVKVNVAALLDETPQEEIRKRRFDEKPYWHVERARIGNTRKVPVELIVNSQSVARKEIVADGNVNEISFDYVPERSGWVALRIFPSSHTNPIFVEVDGRPIRASKKSAQWCLDAVDVCWKSKQDAIRSHEQEAASAAYDIARKAYRDILAESYDDRED